jgi:hypothetical protein
MRKEHGEAQRINSTKKTLRLSSTEKRFFDIDIPGGSVLLCGSPVISVKEKLKALHGGTRRSTEFTEESKKQLRILVRL